MKYITPAVTDYGTLVEITEMQSVTGLTEDSNLKAQPFHHEPNVQPSSPSGP